MDTSPMDRFLQRLEGIEDELNKVVEPFLEEVSELAKEEAQANFDNAMYAGDNDVVVNDPVIEGNTAKITASGVAVNFIEFGTGITFPYNHPDAGINGFTPGGYGKHKGLNPRGWVYPSPTGETHMPGDKLVDKGKKHVRTKGNPANLCMYHAREFVSEHGAMIWKEVKSK